MALFDEKIDELLAKHLAGECSAEEEQAISRWLDESSEHQTYLEELRWLWEHSAEGLPASPRQVNTEEALQQVKSRLQRKGGNSGLHWQRNFFLRAAAVFLLALAAVYWLRTGNTPDPVRIASAGTILTDTLNDGSVVTLREHSGLTLAGNFNRRERRLRLEGEAFFEVAHDTVRPFVVEVQDLEVIVVGTAFTVDNTTEPDKVVVTVTEGKVRVSRNGQSLLLTPGEQATCNLTSGTLVRTTPAQGVPDLQSRMFRFEATPLGTVIQQLSKAYGVTIVLKNKQLETCPLTARYLNLPLERVLELVSQSFSISVEKVENGYTLDGESCGEE